jgi:hypothetical protein
MTAAPSGVRTSVVVTSPNDVLYSPSYVGPQTSLPSASTYTPVEPTRLLPKRTLGPGGTYDLQVTGGSSPVPSGATAVTFNLTGVSPTTSTYLQAYPTPTSGSAFPLVSNLNLTKGQIAAVAVQVALPASGKIRLRNLAGNTGVIVDVSGYFTAGTGAAGYTPLNAPVRVLDTYIGQGQQKSVAVTGVSGAPSDPVAVVLNLTGASPTKSTYLTAFPTPATPGAPPVVSNLNLPAKSVRANLVTLPVGTGGKVSIYNFQGNIRTVVDVEGFYADGGAGLAYYPLTPTRVLDTRTSTYTWYGHPTPISADNVLDASFTGTLTQTAGTTRVPVAASVAVFNLTAAGPSDATYLTVYPPSGSAGPPLASNLNPARGSIVPNLVISRLSAAGVARVYNKAGNTPVLADLAGYYR